MISFHVNPFKSSTFKAWGLLIVITLSITGCGKNPIKDTDFSGFLSDYRDLKPVKLPSGASGLRWTRSDIQQYSLKGLIISPLVFYPEPQIQDQVSAEALEDIQIKWQAILLATAKSHNIPITTTPGPGIARLSSAITSVTVSTQGLSVTEVIPFRLVIAGAAIATGLRDKDVIFNIEYELTDTKSHASLVRGMRQEKTKPLRSDSDALSIKHTDQLFENWQEDLEFAFDGFAELFTRN